MGSVFDHMRTLGRWLAPDAIVRDQRRRHSRDGGFTLIELMVVVLIISILLAIGIPYYMAARTRSQDRAAQSDLTTAVKVETGLYADLQVFTDDVAMLSQEASSQQFVNGNSLDGGEISTYLPPAQAGQMVILGSRSNSGECFYLRRDALGSTAYARVGAAVCDETAPAVVWGPAW